MRKWIVYDDSKNKIITHEPFIIKGKTMWVACEFNKSFEQYKKVMMDIEVLKFSEDIDKYVH